MAAPPRLSAAQWRLIKTDLPASRRDPVVIAALIFRAVEARSLRECSEIFGISRARLNEWEHDLSSAIPKILRKLHLKPAGHLMRLRLHGGQDWRKRHGIYQASMDYRLQGFNQALRRSSLRRD
jgi:hypothetical protein